MKRHLTKKRRLLKKHVKTRMRKMIRNMRGGGNIKEITENTKETEFPQKFAIVNYGKGVISTYNLVNCIAIGGIFTLLDGTEGSFLTHESPTDFKEHQKKLNTIYDILTKKGAVITKLIIFHIDEPSKNIYEGGLTTPIIIERQKEFAESLFRIPAELTTYTCDISSFRCGKAALSPSSYESSIIPFRIDNNGLGATSGSLDINRRASRETYKVIVLENRYGDKIYKCPLCGSISGSYAPQHPDNSQYFRHSPGCPNANKIPVE